MPKNILKNSATLLVTLGLCVLALEVLLRFLPVKEGFNFVAVTEDQPIFHAEPNLVATNSSYWDLFNAQEIAINNVGFRNDQDYSDEGQHPLIGVVGDSYVEAVQVGYDDTFYATLADRFEGKARVYSFGFSGAPLSQYLVWAQYARNEFDVDYLTFVIISNDFDESFFGMIRQYFIGKAQMNGYDVIDLKHAFSDHFANNNQRFESERDAHWNELGHDVIAGALTNLYNQKIVDPR